MQLYAISLSFHYFNANSLGRLGFLLTILLGLDLNFRRSILFKLRFISKTL